jgi:hypothetical protein
VGAVDERFGQVDLSSRSKVLREEPEDLRKHASLYPTLKSTVARLVRRVSPWQIGPRCAGAQHPEHAVHHVPRVPPGSPALGTRSLTLGPRERGADGLPLLVSEVHHNGRSRVRSAVDPPPESDRITGLYARTGCEMRSRAAEGIRSLPGQVRPGSFFSWSARGLHPGLPRPQGRSANPSR